MAAATYRFLAAELQPAHRVLRVDGRDCQIGARAFDLLLALIERRDRVVSKNDAYVCCDDLPNPAGAFHRIHPCQYQSSPVAR
jgi:DNA-binding response OmpR family regulator